MKNFNPFVYLLLFALIFLPGCEAIMGIFQAGFWAGIILVVLVLALIGWGVYSFGSNNTDDDVDTNPRDRR